jgi:hypothetical protein
MVNGEHRIGIFASESCYSFAGSSNITNVSEKPLQPGDEMSLNYGRDFFESTHKRKNNKKTRRRNVKHALSSLGNHNDDK